MPTPTSLTQALVTRFADRRDAPALVPLDTAGESGTAVTYGELDLRARALAVRLAGHGAAGRQVMLALDTGVSFAVALLGCLYAGAVAVPVPPPAVSRAASERTAAIVAEAAVHLVLTESAHAPDVSRQLAQAGRGGVACLAVDGGALAADRELIERTAAEWRMPALGGDDLAIIQYTSGSTAAPRGVMVSHANLLATMAALRDALGTDAGSRIGGWLPFHHDLGLVGELLHPLWLGATVVLMPPRLFLARPGRWLKAIDRYDVTHVAAPDSAYARCVREVTDEELAALDLSRLKRAVDAAEPVGADNLRAFTERFAAAGLRPGTLTPGYGLAEATLLVSVGRGESPAALRGVEDAELRPPGTTRQTVVACGPAGGAEVRVVDPRTSAELPDGAVGELWVRGPAVARGYWARPLETAEAFGNATASGEGGFLRTGDLGAVHDGEVYVTGRIKDVLLVAGRSLHPQEIERQLPHCGTQFASAAVFGVGEANRLLVVVQEVRAIGRGRDELADLATRVRGVLAQEFGAIPDAVLLVRPGTVRRTTSGKVRRSEMRELFLRGELRPLYEELQDPVRALSAGGVPRQTRERVPA
ncbi:fatty acyl-AMP ligase [Streptomyces sp. ICBB 8177]|uniref:fatty acyl-AMP ligase n=1 Tax=Streptomyces sp. ICBB 8177 TaxID=563922 RepID=UPI000D6784A9|nr:fatty acyl-AMP ligase [Streptomyces sp. ICBB 8177]PWI45345.1 polyketide synthase [Streptomyces sp. ICBB 8177]